MLVEVKKIDPVRRELKFKIGKDRVSKALESVYQEISKVAKVKGFRPGKAPRAIVEQQHSQVAQEELIRKLIPEVYQEGLEKEKIAPIDYPEIEDVQFKDGEMTFTAKLDIRPEINLKQYKGLKVTRKSSQVTEEEIGKTLDYFKKGQGEGKEIVLDDAFAHGLGYPNLEEFKNSLKRQLELDKDRQNRHDVEHQLIENLLGQVKITVPQGLLKKQLDHRVHDAKHRLEHQGVPKEEIQKREETMRNDLKDSVEKDLKVFLVLDKIAELEKLDIKENENMPAKVIEFLLKEAKWEA
jgi:FKBP-type peptidyl-prolyl cis-trans isomerase (trigger factor)